MTHWRRAGKHPFQADISLGPISGGKVAATGQIIHFNLYRHEIDSGKGPIFQNGRNQGYSTSLHGGNGGARLVAEVDPKVSTEILVLRSSEKL